MRNTLMYKAIIFKCNKTTTSNVIKELNQRLSKKDVWKKQIIITTFIKGGSYGKTVVIVPVRCR